MLQCEYCARKFEGNARGLAEKTFHELFHELFHEFQLTAQEK